MLEMLDTLNEVDAISLLVEELTAIEVIGDTTIIHTTVGALKWHDEVLTFSPPLKPVALKLIEKSPTVKQLQSQSP